MIGIASPASRGSAQSAKAKLGADFPNAVDLAGATYALFDVAPTRSFGFVIDENGKIVYGYDLGFVLTGTKESYFAKNAERYLNNAKDPFGIGKVPGACKAAYDALKLGQFDTARALAKRLTRSSDASVKGVASKIVAAADETENKKVDHMGKLSGEGKAGELYEEIKAFKAAFPRSKHSSKLGSLLSKARSKDPGKKEYLAVKNFERAATLLKSSKRQAISVLSAISTQLGETPHGKLAGVLASKLQGAR